MWSLKPQLELEAEHSSSMMLYAPLGTAQVNTAPELQQGREGQGIARNSKVQSWHFQSTRTVPVYIHCIEPIGRTISKQYLFECVLGLGSKETNRKGSILDNAKNLRFVQFAWYQWVTSESGDTFWIYSEWSRDRHCMVLSTPNLCRKLLCTLANDTS